MKTGSRLPLSSFMLSTQGIATLLVFSAVLSGSAFAAAPIPFQPTITIHRDNSPFVAKATTVKPMRTESRPAIALPGMRPGKKTGSVRKEASLVEVLWEDFTMFPGGYPAGYDFGVPFAPVEGVANWTIYDLSNPPLGSSWGRVNIGPATGVDEDYVAAPAGFGPNAFDPFTPSPNGGYPNNAYAWLDFGPFDASWAATLSAQFWLWFDTEPDYDAILFCVSTHGQNYSCADPWSGYSGDWLNPAFSLDTFAGSPTVYLAWVFISDDSNGGDVGYLGAFLDEIYVYGNPPAPAEAAARRD